MSVLIAACCDAHSLSLLLFVLSVAVEKLKSIIDSPTAWQPRYAAVLEENETRVPECAENLMNLIAGITGEKEAIVLNCTCLYTNLQLPLQSDID